VVYVSSFDIFIIFNLLGESYPLSRYRFCIMLLEEEEEEEEEEEYKPLLILLTITMLSSFLLHSFHVMFIGCSNKKQIKWNFMLICQYITFCSSSSSSISWISACKALPLKELSHTYIHTHIYYQTMIATSPSDAYGIIIIDL
jgi:hypothetical protein